MSPPDAPPDPPDDAAPPAVTVCEWRTFRPEAVYELIAVAGRGSVYVVATVEGLEFTVPLTGDDLLSLALLTASGVGDPEAGFAFEGEWIAAAGPLALWQLARTTPSRRATLAFERTGAGLARFALGVDRVRSGHLPSEPDVPDPQALAAARAGGDGSTTADDEPDPFVAGPSEDDLRAIDSEPDEE